MMASHMMGTGPFFYYNPDPSPETRQHGHFSQHPALQQQMQMYPVVPTLPSTPIYSRPSSSCSQPPVPTKVFNNVSSNMTPMASPQMATRKPAIFIQNHSSKLMLDTDIYEHDNFYYPATPPLSTSGASSPGSTEILATPLNPMFSGLEGCENVKPDPEAVPESLEGLDWSNCGSPPLTPGRSIIVSFSKVPLRSAPSVWLRWLAGWPARGPYFWRAENSSKGCRIGTPRINFGPRP
jgi:hypothetical protein